MPTVKAKEINKEGCEFCSYVLGGDEAHPEFHCGLEYFKIHPLERVIKKLNEYPIVSAQYQCAEWKHK
jgi:hypothetical protein